MVRPISSWSLSITQTSIFSVQMKYRKHRPIWRKLIFFRPLNKLETVESLRERRFASHLIQSKRVLAFLAGLKVKLKRHLTQMMLMKGMLPFYIHRISALISPVHSVETGPGAIVPPSLGKCLDLIDPENSCWCHQLKTDNKSSIRNSETIKNFNRFRLERFGKAMSGTGSWEVPGAVLNGKGLNFLNICVNFLHRVWLEFSTSWKLGCWRWGRNRLYKYAPCFSLFLNGWRWTRPKVRYPGSSCGSRNGWKGTLQPYSVWSFRWRSRTGLESEMPRTIRISSHLPRHVVTACDYSSFRKPPILNSSWLLQDTACPERSCISASRSFTRLAQWFCTTDPSAASWGCHNWYEAPYSRFCSASGMSRRYRHIWWLRRRRRCRKRPCSCSFTSESG